MIFLPPVRTQDFNTPQEQFNVGYAIGASTSMDGMGMLLERSAISHDSPAPSPHKPFQKRHRPVAENDSDNGTSQDDMSVSQSRSQGEPSSSSKATIAGLSGRPPIPKSNRRRSHPRGGGAPGRVNSREGVIQHPGSGSGRGRGGEGGFHPGANSRHHPHPSAPGLHSSDPSDLHVSEARL